MNKGVLYLFPTFIGRREEKSSFPSNNLSLAKSINVWVVENARDFRRFLRDFGIPSPYDHLKIIEINRKKQDAFELEEVYKALEKGVNVGLASDAGCPGVADPGSAVVQRAHEMDIKVIPLVGPSSILLALMASGLNGQQFTFHGYLPVKDHELTTKLKSIELHSKRENSTEIFIETPYRNASLLAKLKKQLDPSTLLSIASDLQGEDETISTKSVSDWKKCEIDLGKKPTVFMLLSSRYSKRM